MNWVPGFPHEMPMLIQDLELDVYVWLSAFTLENWYKDNRSKFDSCSIFAAMYNKMSIFPSPSNHAILHSSRLPKSCPM